MYVVSVSNDVSNHLYTVDVSNDFLQCHNIGYHIVHYKASSLNSWPKNSFTNCMVIITLFNRILKRLSISINWNRYFIHIHLNHFILFQFNCVYVFFFSVDWLLGCKLRERERSNTWSGICVYSHCEECSVEWREKYNVFCVRCWLDTQWSSWGDLQSFICFVSVCTGYCMGTKLLRSPKACLMALSPFNCCKYCVYPICNQ